MQYWRYEKDYGSGKKVQIPACSPLPEELQTDEAQRARVLKRIETLLQIGSRKLNESKEKRYAELFKQTQAYVKLHRGKIKAEISDEVEGGKIVAELPYWKFEEKGRSSMMVALAFADCVSFSLVEENQGVKLIAHVWFFEYSLGDKKKDNPVECEIQKQARLLELLKKYEKLAKL